jgi:hypothetical protein
MLLVALALSAASPAELPRVLRPIEQCTTDAGFNQFRSRLKQIVAKRDRTAFLALLAPEVLVNFGGGSGPKAFEGEWSFDHSEYGNVWGQLEKMLKMGCARDGKSRIIPSLSMQIDQNYDEDWVLVLPPGGMIFDVVNNEVVYSEVMPWAVAAVTDRNSDTRTYVKLSDGRTGSLSDDELYEPTGYRMIVEKRGGKWMITAFVAGD